MLNHVLLAALWVAAFLALTLLGSPTMLGSGIPFLTMFAFVAPCLWVLASVVLYIAWAESGWRDEWERPTPAEAISQATLHHQPIPRTC